MSGEYRETENKIILTGETAKRFNRLAHTQNADSQRKRDKFIKEISETIQVERKGEKTIIHNKIKCLV